MNNLISKELLLSAGFEDVTYDYEKQFHKKYDGLDDYIMLRFWTSDYDNNTGKVLKLDIDNGLTNSGRLWHVHVDNCDCCSIGSADIDTVEQFNKLMEVFDSNFRLNND